MQDYTTVIIYHGCNIIVVVTEKKLELRVKAAVSSFLAHVTVRPGTKWIVFHEKFSSLDRKIDFYLSTSAITFPCFHYVQFFPKISYMFM
jgi:hypothetical protein